jgi:hypothetical protein
MKKDAALSQLARFVLLPSQWGPEADRWARSLPADSPENTAEDLAQRVREGTAKVCDLMEGETKRGFIVFTVTPGHELFVLAAFGRAKRENLMEVLIPLVDALARAAECDSVRFNTMRPGMIRRAQEHGFRVSEIIMRKAVK